MNTAYWAGEFAKVLLAYVVLMYVWPSVLFRKHLKEKSRTYRFAFCSTVSIMLISTCVLGLGVFHILHKWLVCFLFYGSVLVSLLWGKKWSDTGLVHLHQLLIGTRGWKLYTLRAMQKAGHCIKKFFKMASKNSNYRKYCYHSDPQEWAGIPGFILFKRRCRCSIYRLGFFLCGVFRRYR